MAGAQIPRTDALEHRGLAGLLEAAETHAEVAEGFADAYGALGLEERDALLHDLLPRLTAGTLVLLLEREQDPGLALRVGLALMRVDRDVKEAQGWRWGDAHRGGIALVRRRYRPYWECLVVGWDADRYAPIRFDPFVSASSQADALQTLAIPGRADRIDADYALNLLAERLWASRRRCGHLPSSLRPLAGLFHPYASGG